MCSISYVMYDKNLQFLVVWTVNIVSCGKFGVSIRRRSRNEPLIKYATVQNFMNAPIYNYVNLKEEQNLNIMKFHFSDIFSNSSKIFHQISDQSSGKNNCILEKNFNVKLKLNVCTFILKASCSPIENNSLELNYFWCIQ